MAAEVKKTKRLASARKQKQEIEYRDHLRAEWEQKVQQQDSIYQENEESVLQLEEEERIMVDKLN